MRDTTPEAAELQVKIYRRMTNVERLRVAMRLSADAREFAIARLRRTHPGWSEQQLRRELIRISLLPAPLPSALR